MKRRSALLTLVVLLFSCKENIVNPPGEVDPRLQIHVDPRMELLAVIQHFTSWAGTGHIQANIRYKTDLQNYFKNYANSPAVVQCQQLINSGFAYDAPAEFVLYHTDPPQFEQTIPFSSSLINRAGSESALKDFAEAIRGFAAESGFMEFYNAHESLYTEFENQVKTAVAGTNYIQILEEYYGEKKNSYTLIPAPLFSGNYGPRIVSSSGTDVYSICGPMSILNNQPFFNDRNFLEYLLSHEFSHSFVNPVTEKYLTELNRSDALYEPVRDVMTRQGYNNWRVCVNEHLIRTNVARFALQRGMTYHDQIIQTELKNGFIYIANLDTLMDRYENNREMYETYESFYPEIIKLFDSL